jgi:ketosteroid isomerase-like protein
MNRGRLMLLIALVLCAPARTHAQQSATQTVELPAELARVLRDYESAWRARDPQRLAALFHPDGFVLSSGSPPVRGRAAIAQQYRNAGGNLYLHAVSYAVSDTVGYIIGLFGGTPTDHGGKFVLTLRRQNVRQPWLIGADIDNRNSR